MHVEAYPPDKRCRDLDNILKIILDSLEGAQVFENDNQIDRILLERKETGKPGKVIVSIFEIK